jgi:hypothetical protein
MWFVNATLLFNANVNICLNALLLRKLTPVHSESRAQRHSYANCRDTNTLSWHFVFCVIFPQATSEIKAGHVLVTTNLN